MKLKSFLHQQINEIRNTPRVADRQTLGVRYGIDEKGLDCPLDNLSHFDMTRDLPLDVLHHLTLGWIKKALERLKEDFFSAADLAQVCAILDKCVVWKVSEAGFFYSRHPPIHAQKLTSTYS